MITPNPKAALLLAIAEAIFTIAGGLRSLGKAIEIYAQSLS